MEVRPFDIAFLPYPTSTSFPSFIPTVLPTSTIFRSTRTHMYDVAISFAGPQRPLAESLAARVKEAGFHVFFDDYYPEQLWGKNLVEYFDEVYRKQSRYCVIFMSAEYKERLWTTLERQSAQARAFHEKGKAPRRVPSTRRATTTSYPL